MIKKEPTSSEELKEVAKTLLKTISEIVDFSKQLIKDHESIKIMLNSIQHTTGELEKIVLLGNGKEALTVRVAVLEDSSKEEVEKKVHRREFRKEVIVAIIAAALGIAATFFSMHC